MTHMSPSARFGALALSLLLPRVAVVAQGASTRIATVEVRAGRDALSQGISPWQDQGVTLGLRASARTGVSVTAERMERFGLDDQRLQGELSFALGRRLTLGVEGEVSTTHQVVAKDGGAAQLHLSLPGGWGVAARGSMRRYTAVEVQGASFSLERYWGNFLASYSAAPVRLADAPVVTTHSARLSRFFGARGSVTVMGASGKEVEALAAAGPLVAAVRAAGAWGVIPVAPHLALTWGADVTRYEGLFTRRHVSLGARVSSR